MSGRKVHEAITGQSRHIAMAVFTVWALRLSMRASKGPGLPVQAPGWAGACRKARSDRPSQFLARDVIGPGQQGHLSAGTLRRRVGM